MLKTYLRSEIRQCCRIVLTVKSKYLCEKYLLYLGSLLSCSISGYGHTERWRPLVFTMILKTCSMEYSGKEISFIHDANSDKQRMSYLFAKVRKRGNTYLDRFYSKDGSKRCPEYKPIYYMTLMCLGVRLIWSKLGVSSVKATKMKSPYIPLCTENTFDAYLWQTHWKQTKLH